MNSAAPLDDTARIETVLAAQRAAFLRDGAPDLAQRKDDLTRLRRAIIANRSRIEDAVAADFGHRSRHETSLMETLSVVKGIDYLLSNLRRFMRPARRHVALTMRSGKAWVVYQPRGVVGIMSPWNYPFSLAMMPLATALAAGNRAMIKPSELTPRTAALIRDLLAGLFGEDRVAVIEGGPAVGAAFSALPFDFLLFTGSTQIGRSVMRAASDNLVPVTLELGGKSPAIVAPGQLSHRTLSSLAYGKLANAGQTCVAPDYVLLHQDDLSGFVEGYGKAVSALYPRGPASPDYSAIIDARHFDRLNALLADARDKGARVVPVGVRPETAAGRPQTLAPTVVLDATDAMTVMQDEIFGPILPVLTYSTLDDAIAYVNARPRPLALYYFGPKGDDCDRVLARTTSGNAAVNSTLLHYAVDDLSFGGVGPSGMGAYHGREGFISMSHAKGIYAQGRYSIGNLVRAPFGRLVNLTLRALLR